VLPAWAREVVGGEAASAAVVAAAQLPVLEKSVVHLHCCKQGGKERRKFI